MVPNGWEVKKLEDVVSKTRKITYGIVVPGPYEPNGNLMIRAKDYSFGWQPIESIYRVSDQMHQSYKRSKVRKGDVLLTIVGSIGNTAIVPEDLEGANITQQTARLSFDEHDANFFYSVMSSGIGKKEIYRYAKSGVQPSLNLADIAKFKVPVPPFQEQQKIAKILSTWDKAISTTERLIDNSTQQKKALMQQLLTGKKRLLDDDRNRFEGEWEKVKLSAVAQITMGSSPKSEAYNDVSDGLPLLQGNADIKNRKSVPRIYTSQITKECHIDDILFSVRAPVGTVAISNHHACIGRGIAAIKAKKNHSQDYLYQWLLSFETKWERYSQGSTFEAVNSNDIKSLNLSVPALPEQQKIATVLTNADKEIELLEQQLADLQQEKKALMQVLLRGKKRVVVDGEIA
ncbi:restriction endonuclease subunit S [Psychrobacter immobilis]|uniref:restriction endonuclease subunit S n=1 Tax=Psychrobacter immobilis TaxID=498 RepID=UPI001918650F|nr:restriction endonuclease subunit S [Psychrobacter immobilis]